MSSWVSQGVLMGATGATGSTGPAGGQSTTTTSSFTMPALNAAVTIAVSSAAWTKLGQTLYISDGTNSGWWEITTRTSNTSLAVTNRGYTGNPASGTMATAATVQLIGPGIALGTVPGFSPGEPVRSTTTASFVIPALAGNVNITLASAAWTLAGQTLWISDGTRMGFFEILTRTSATALSIVNKGYLNNPTGTMSTGAQIVLMGMGYVTSTTPGIMPPFDSTMFGITGGNFTLSVVPPHGAQHASTDPTGGTSHYYDCDDFLGPPKWATIGTSGGTGGVAAAVFPAAFNAAGRMGIIQLSPGTVVSNYSRLFANPIALNTQTCTWRAQIFHTLAAGVVDQLFIGFADQVGPVLDATHNYIGILLVPVSSANWQTICRASAAVTQTTSSTAATISTWFDLKIVAASTSVAFYVNGTLINTISTNIPSATAGLNPCVFIADNSNTANYTVYVDAIEIDYDSGIAGKFMKTPI